jgi:hypothetical protein
MNKIMELMNIIISSKNSKIRKMLIRKEEVNRVII